MIASDLRKAIAEGESERLQFQNSALTAKSAAQTLTAFLNHRGGRMLIGVSSDGEIAGVGKADELTRMLQREVGSLISPSALWTVQPVDMGGKMVVVLEAHEGADKPYVAGGAIFVRRGTKTIAADRDEISRLIGHRSDSGGRWERQIVSGVELRDLDLDLIRETAQMAVDADRWRGEPRDSSAFLHSLGLSENGGITNAALALFGLEPTRQLPQLRVRLLVAPEGKTGDRYEFEKIFDDNLIRVAEQIPTMLEARVGGVQSQFSDAWQREDHRAYPTSALREGVMNALVHRDYEQRGSIIVCVMPSSIKISNPGNLPGMLRPGDLKKAHPSVPRNPDIAHVCYLRGMIENVGRGTQRILEECKRAKLKQPKWETSKLETSLTFFSYEKRDLTIGDLSDRQAEILNILKGGGSLSAKEIFTHFKDRVTDRTVRGDLRHLVESGFLSQRGKGPSTTYQVPD